MLTLNGRLQRLDATLPSHVRHHPTPTYVTPKFKTRHLGVPDNFYTSRSRVDDVAELRLPDSILPKYSDLVYKIVLRGVALRAYLPFIPEDQRRCLFCPESETYQHLFVDCHYTSDVWSEFEPLFVCLGATIPDTLALRLFSQPTPSRRSFRAPCTQVWKILRACVWFQLWRVRNDRAFRSDLPLPSPLTTAARAAAIFRLHLHHLLRKDPDDGALVRLLLVWLTHDWARQHVVPGVIAAAAHP
jgi:hypothetical protein